MPSSNSTYITLVIIYTLEAVLIILGNTFRIFVFWTERSRLKRTYFLLVNLAVADLLVGITELIIIGTAKSHNVGEGYGFLMRSRANPIAPFILLFSGTSVYFLALISMERAFDPSSRHKQSSLQLQHRYCLGCRPYFLWFYRIILPLFRFCGGICFPHFQDILSYFLFDNLCKLPKHTQSIANTTTRGARQSQASIKGAQFTIFENSFYRNCFIACVLDACFCCLLNERILSAMLYTTGVLARGCHVSGKFYGESSRVQFQNANF